MAFNPIVDALKKQAKGDHTAAVILDAQRNFPDWVVIISFYMVLHTVNAHAENAGWKWKKYGKRDPSKISRHAQTLRYVSKTFGRDVFRRYNRLYTECWNARYDPFYLSSTTHLDANTLFLLAEQLMTSIP